MTGNMTDEKMPPLVVDRSPELARAAGGRGSGPVLDIYHLERDQVHSIVAESEPGDGGSCVLASYLRQQLPGCEPHIEGEHPYIDYNGKRIEVTLEPGIVEQIGKFDRGEPGAFKDGFQVTFQGA